jgi:hypothetical protein
LIGRTSPLAAFPFRLVIATLPCRSIDGTLLHKSRPYFAASVDLQVQHRFTDHQCKKIGKAWFGMATFAARRAAPVSEALGGQAHTGRERGTAGRRDEPALSPEKVERVGARFIRPQQGKPECQSDN